MRGHVPEVHSVDMRRPELLSRDNLSRDVRTVVVALLVSFLVMATPSVAAKIKNAHKVDGKHAVGAGASVTKRAGKLVATNRQGRLPDNIIRRAPDADRLDGLDSTALVPRDASPGSVQVGLWSAWGGGGAYVADAVAFQSRLPFDVAEPRVTFVPSGSAFTTECPAYRTVAAVGWGCFYELNAANTSLGEIFRQNSSGGGANGLSRDGFGIYFNCFGATCYSYGQWVVSAPAGASARSAPRRAPANPS